MKSHTPWLVAKWLTLNTRKDRTNGLEAYREYDNHKTTTLIDKLLNSDYLQFTGDSVGGRDIHAAVFRLSDFLSHKNITIINRSVRPAWPMWLSPRSYQ